MRVEILYSKVYPFFKKKVDKKNFTLLIAFILKIEQNYQTYLENFYCRKVGFFQFLKTIFFSFRLSKNYPFEHITKKIDFLSCKFYVNPSVLIPRPETEELVNFFIHENSHLYNKKITVLEIGTGSGVIAISIKKRFPLAKVIALDICPKALKVAKKNAKKILTAGEKITFIENDFLKVTEKFKKIDFIISNPPYVALNQKKYFSPEIFYEPSKALFSQKNGYSFYLQFAKCFQKILNKDGKFYLEFGFNQAEKLQEIFSLNYKILIKKDMSQKNRFLVGNLKNN